MIMIKFSKAEKLLPIWREAFLDVQEGNLSVERAAVYLDQNSFLPASLPRALVLGLFDIVHLCFELLDTSSERADLTLLFFRGMVALASVISERLLLQHSWLLCEFFFSCFFQDSSRSRKVECASVLRFREWPLRP